MNKWLNGFAYRIEIYWWIFVISLLLILFITIIVVTIRSLKTAMENPVKALNQ